MTTSPLKSAGYTAQEIADYILWYCTEIGNPISNHRLQKILYYCWKAYYYHTGKLLFTDKFADWKTGCLIETVYWRYCHYAFAKIYKKDIPDNWQKLSILNGVIDKCLTVSLNELIEASKKDIL